MKYFTIGEMSKLSFVSTQTLRYYDKIGLLKPGRCNESSGYRYYTYREVMKLDEIQYMKLFGMRLEEIMWQFENRSAYNSYETMERQRKYIEEKIKEMGNIHKRIVHNMNNLNVKQMPYFSQEPEIIFCKQRKAVSLEVAITTEEEYEIYIRQLSHELYSNSFSDMGDYYAACSIADLKARNFRQYTSIGIVVLDDVEGLPSREISQGEYACIYHVGEYSAIQESYGKLCDYLEGQGYVIWGEGLEVYIIDNMDSNNPKEYVTHLQIPVKKREEEK